MSSTECPICYDEMTEAWSIISQGAKDQPEGENLELHQDIVCTHSFCKECILLQIETCDRNGQARICPLCKVVISKIYKNTFVTSLIQERIALDKRIREDVPDPSIVRDLEEKARIAEEGRIQALLEKAQAEQNVEEIRRTIEEQNQLLERSRRLKEEAEARHQEFLDELGRRAEEMRQLAQEKEEQQKRLEEARMEANEEHHKIEELERNLRAKEKEIEETAQNLKQLEEQNALNLENLNQFQSKASTLERSLQSLRAARLSISSSSSSSSSSSPSSSSSSSSASAPSISHSAGSYLSSIMKAFGFGSKDPSVPDFSFNPQDFKIFERRGVSKRSGVSRAEVVATKKVIALKQKFIPPNSPTDLHASLVEAFLLRHFKYVPSFISSQKVYFSLPDASSPFTYNEENARICMELEPFMRYDLEFMINEKRNLFKDVDVIRTVMYRLLVGLNELHSAGIVHYQVFPNNVLFESLQGGSEKTCRLAGFGSANFVQFFRSSNPIPVPSRYSLNFTAPEIFLHIIHSLQKKSSLFPREYNWTSADIWSCGCIMAMMFLGRSLFQATTRSEYLEAIAAVEECKFSGLRKGVKLQKRSILDKVPDADAADLLSRMIKTDPKSRISAKDCLRHPFFDDLRPSPAHNFSAPPPSPSPEDFQAFLEEIKVVKPDPSSSSSSSSSA